MNKSTIEFLYYGKKRQIAQQEYSKLRTYNKIKTDRSHESTLLRRLQPAVNQYVQLTTHQLRQAIEYLQKQNLILGEQNKTILNELMKIRKIEKLMAKLLIVQNQNEKQPLKSSNLRVQQQNSIKYIQTIEQIKLALDVIKLQSKLQEKCQQYVKIANYKRKKNQENIKNMFKVQKSTFLSTIFQNNKQLQQIISNFQIQDRNLKQKMSILSKKAHNTKKQKINKLKRIQQLTYQMKQLTNSADNRKKRFKKNSYEYYQTQNGEVKNQQDIKKQINEIKEKRKQESQQLQLLIQGKMLQKIALINYMENYKSEQKKQNKLFQSNGDLRLSISFT